MSQEPKYDSTADTLLHKSRVNDFMVLLICKLLERAASHDESKLVGVEKECFDTITPRLKEYEYGSDEYKATLHEMQGAIRNHYQFNRHHPEHFAEGVDGMNVVDLVEMLCDWLAAVERNKDGDIAKSLEINRKRFEIGEQLMCILKNTVVEYFPVSLLSVG